MKWRVKFWGTFAIILGAWESIAFGTKALPTISRANWILHKKYGWKSKTPVLALIMGITKHLLCPPKE